MYPMNGLDSKSDHKQSGEEYNYCIKLQPLEITSQVFPNQPPTTPNPTQKLTSQNMMIFLVTQVKLNLTQCIKRVCRIDEYCIDLIKLYPEK
jgi:hypothetical protein